MAPTTSKTLSNERVVVVGAGLVGSLLSLMLARKGYSVLLLEKRPDLRTHQLSAGRSINLAISTRGFHALKECGLEERVRRLSLAMPGRSLHLLSESQDEVPTFQPYGKTEEEAIYSMSRSGLNGILLDAAEETGRVHIRFSTEVKKCDPAARVISVEGLDGHQSEVSYSRQFGTDGSASVVRDAIAGKVESSLLSHGYKELTLPPQKDAKRFSLNALHIWPRGQFMLIALPNVDSTFTCTLFLPLQGGAGVPGFDTLKTPAQAHAFFKQHFPDVVDRLEDFPEAFFKNPTGKMVTIRCPKWRFEDSILLLGDAAHAIVPFYGQGANCGFEDVTVLNSLLSQGTPEWATLFERFEEMRKPNSNAIADMAIENFFEMRDRVGDKGFQIGKALEKKLLQAFEGRFFSRYSLVSFSRAPYRLALEVGQVSDEIVKELSQGMSSMDDIAKVDLANADRLIREKLEPVLAKRSGEIGTWT